MTPFLEMRQRLLDYFSGGRVHAGVILAGPDKGAKKPVAREIAKCLLCPSGKPPFCNVCSTCRRIDRDLHPDVLWLCEEEEESIKIEVVRETCHQMAVAPLEAHAKICIIEECHRMTTASANAFLKTLEEPGNNRYFLLLTTQPNSLLPTVVSRCVRFSFRPEPKAVEIPLADCEAFHGLLAEAVKTRNLAPLVAALSDKERALSFVQYLQTQMRSQTVKNQSEFPFSQMDTYRLLASFDEAVKLEGRLRSNANYGLMLESFLRTEILRPSP